ncbi:MAG: NTP transferase domain-containing protein, partial [Erysipelotrichaceae bacterium]|nr:NTP transferase domain-containing protein [Erysipelotrichaceae bacterium]
MKPTLVILAAGMGSRYGGMKQIDAVGSNGEPIIDFSIYDAHEAGFEKVVLIIKKEHEELFRKNLTDKVAQHMEVAFAYQDINDLPEGI